MVETSSANFGSTSLWQIAEGERLKAVNLYWLHHHWLELVLSPQKLVHLWEFLLSLKYCSASAACLQLTNQLTTWKSSNLGHISENLDNVCQTWTTNRVFVDHTVSLSWAPRRDSTFIPVPMGKNLTFGVSKVNAEAALYWRKLANMW